MHPVGALQPAGSLLGLESAADVFHEQHKVKFVCGAWLELRYEMCVEVSGVGGFGVDEQAAAANVVREFGKPSEDILEHARCQSDAFVVDVHPESSQEGHRLGIAASALACPTGRGAGLELGHAPGVIGDYPGAVVLSDDEDSRGTDCD